MWRDFVACRRGWSRREQWEKGKQVVAGWCVGVVLVYLACSNLGASEQDNTTMCLRVSPVEVPAGKVAICVGDVRACFLQTKIQILTSSFDQI